MHGKHSTRTQELSMVMEVAKLNSTLTEINELEHKTQILVFKQQTCLIPRSLSHLKPPTFKEVAILSIML